MAYSQLMGITTLLVKPGAPNYMLLAKLCRAMIEFLVDVKNDLSKHTQKSSPIIADPILMFMVKFQKFPNPNIIIMVF